MAISNILPRKTMRNRTRLQSMTERHDYDQKAEKTRDGELVSSYMCSPETAAKEFEESKQLYHQLTGRKQPPKRDVIMYRVIQSFKPGEVSPEEANRIGYELAMKFTGGQHQFVVSTHVDKKHIHTHIEFNSTNLNCDGKFVMLSDIKNGMVDCVIVKDLSRLGREHIDTSRYIRQIFPAFGVRFVAINDNIDTANEHTGDDLVVSIKSTEDVIFMQGGGLDGPEKPKKYRSPAA